MVKKSKISFIWFIVLAKQFIQEVYLPDEVYENDYAEVTKKLFKSTKLAMEYEVRLIIVLIY